MGIVTASDFTIEFRTLAEPFLLIGEIENHLRNLIEPHFAPEALRTAKTPNDPARRIEKVSDLTFGECILYLSRPDEWAKLGLKLDRQTFAEAMVRVRDIRNDVTHFDPGPLSQANLQTLRKSARFLGVVARLHAHAPS